MRQGWLMTGLALLALAAPAMAAEVAGVKLQETVSVGGKDLVLNGAGVRTRMVFKVYVAALYLPAKAADLPATLAQSPRRVQMTLLRNVGADDLVQALVVPGVTISNVTFSGAPVAAGLFSGGAGILGFDTGVVLLMRPPAESAIAPAAATHPALACPA